MFAVMDRVKVIDPQCVFNGEKGTVVRVPDGQTSTDMVEVRMDTDEMKVWFYPQDLVEVPFKPRNTRDWDYETAHHRMHG